MDQLLHMDSPTLNTKKNAELGKKVVTYSRDIWLEEEDVKLFALNEEITLMNWSNAFVREIHKEGEKIIRVTAELNPSGNFKDTDKRVTWLANTDDLAEVVIVEYDTLISKKSLDENDKFESYINNTIKYETPAIAEPTLRLLKKGDQLQLERRGYFIVDSSYINPTKPIVLILTPDGKEKDASVLSNQVRKRKL